MDYLKYIFAAAAFTIFVFILKAISGSGKEERELRKRELFLLKLKIETLIEQGAREDDPQILELRKTIRSLEASNEIGIFVFIIIGLILFFLLMYIQNNWTKH